MRDQIVAVLRAGEQMTAMELRAAVGASYVANVRTALYALERQGYVERVEGSFPTLWRAKA